MNILTAEVNRSTYIENNSFHFFLKVKTNVTLIYIRKNQFLTKL